MNPYLGYGRVVMEALAYRDAQERAVRDARRDQLHRAAVARRRKAKKGGKR